MSNLPSIGSWPADLGLAASSSLLCSGASALSDRHILRLIDHCVPSVLCWLQHNKERNGKVTAQHSVFILPLLWQRHFLTNPASFCSETDPGLLGTGKKSPSGDTVTMASCPEIALASNTLTAIEIMTSNSVWQRRSREWRWREWWRQYYVKLDFSYVVRNWITTA